MTRLRWWMFFGVLLPVFALTVAGCKKSADDDDDERGGRPRNKPKGAVVAKETPLDVKAYGTIKGRVLFDGDSPGRTSIADQVKANKDDSPRCMADKSKDSFETAYWKVGEGKGVADAVVFIRAPKGFTFPDSVIKKAVDKDTLTIDQPYCAFEPHVSALLPGQKLVIQNSAPMLHNTKYQGDPVKNPGDNVTLQGKADDNPPQKREVTDLKPDPKTPVKLQCNAHTWMNGFVWASDTPYAYVTRIKEEGKPDPGVPDGSYEFKNVPAGVDLRLAIWHEKTGWGEGGPEGVPIKIEADKVETKDLKVKDK